MSKYWDGDEWVPDEIHVKYYKEVFHLKRKVVDLQKEIEKLKRQIVDYDMLMNEF